MVVIHLSDEFLAPYRTTQPPLNELGSFVYYRTYSRWLPTEGRREHWHETVQRVVEFNINLDPDPSIAEAEKIFDNIFHLRQFPAGRSLWIGGTEAGQAYALANFNCAFRVIDSLGAFGELFYLLMCGTGAGFRVLPEDVSHIPPLRPIEVEHMPYLSFPASMRLEHTESSLIDGVLTIEVGDSKEGWVEALDLFLRSALTDAPVYKVNFIYDNVRPKGERLKRFGGTASGHESLRNMFEKIGSVINNLPDGQMRPVDALDIANIIGENVVVGGKFSLCLQH